MIGVVGPGAVEALAGRILQRRVAAGDRGMDHAERGVSPDPRGEGGAGDGDRLAQRQRKQVGLDLVDPDRRNPARLDLEQSRKCQRNPWLRHRREQVGVLGPLARPADGRGRGPGIDIRDTAHHHTDPEHVPCLGQWGPGRAERERDREDSECLRFIRLRPRGACSLRDQARRENQRQCQHCGGGAHHCTTIEPRMPEVGVPCSVQKYL